MKTITPRTVKTLMKGFTNIATLAVISMMSFSAYAQNVFPTNGNVGIGTSSPSDRLHVRGGSIRLGFSTTQADRDVSVMEIGDGGFIKLGEWELNDRLSFYARSGYSFTGGKVGIGEAPSSTNTLQVLGTLGISPHAATPGPTHATLSIGSYNISNTNSQSGRSLSIGRSDKNIMFISESGNVGIGSQSSPHSTTYKLSVAGSIRAQEIVCETGWADFVFEENYKLRDLAEVETFIKKNKHLPEIPSAKEVEANGVRMAEMEAKLLQKIEELTLYAIKANKEIESLKATMAEMKANQNKTK